MQLQTGAEHMAKPAKRRQGPTERLAEMARQCVDETELDREAANELLEEKVEANPKLHKALARQAYASLYRAAIGDAMTQHMRQVKSGEAVEVAKFDHERHDKIREQQKATKMRLAFLDSWTLRDGTRLRQATGRQCVEEAEWREARMDTDGKSARFYRALVKKTGLDGEVGDAFDDAKSQALWHKINRG